MNIAVNHAGGVLPQKEAEEWKLRYRELLAKADIECPPPDKPDKPTRGIKRSKARNLLERLVNYEDDVLRFMTNSCVPFTN